MIAVGLPMQEYVDLPDDLIGMENKPPIAYTAPYIPTDFCIQLSSGSTVYRACKVS